MGRAGSRGTRLGWAGLVATCLITTGCSAGSSSEEPDTAPEGLRSTAAAAAGDSDRLLEKAVADDGPGCSAAVAVRGDVVWSAQRGLADVDAGRRITEETQFDIASVSKQFTATAVLLLAEEGSLGLGDTLATHVTGLPAWAEDVTLEQLLHHTAGVPDYTPLLMDGGLAITEPSSQEDALDAIAAVPSLEAQGTFRYSNSHYVLLAEVVRAAAGVDLPTFLHERVFVPLGLAMGMEPGARSATIATPYAQDGTRWRATPSGWTQLGDGSVYGTPSDLARWGDQYRTGEVGGPTWLDAVTEGAVPTGGPTGARYGAGIEVAPDGALSHLGGWSGYVSVFGVSADRDTTIALSCNTSDLPIEDLAAGLLETWVG